MIDIVHIGLVSRPYVQNESAADLCWIADLRQERRGPSKATLKEMHFQDASTAANRNLYVTSAVAALTLSLLSDSRLTLSPRKMIL